MGCWEETCGLTNTPIFHGQPCVLVLLDRVVEVKGLSVGASFVEQVVSIHKGTYNEYGGVEAAFPNRDDVTAILFHESAWNGACGYGLTVDASADNVWRKFRGKPEIPQLGEFLTVYAFASLVRRDILSGLQHRGRQEPLGDWRKPYRFVEKLAHDCLKIPCGGVKSVSDVKQGTNLGQKESQHEQ